MMTYELWEMYMRQTFIILLKAGPQNNVTAETGPQCEKGCCRPLRYR